MGRLPLEVILAQEVEEEKQQRGVECEKGVIRQESPSPILSSRAY